MGFPVLISARLSPPIPLVLTPHPAHTSAAAGGPPPSPSLSGQLHFISKAQEEGDASPKESAPEKFEVTGFRERGLPANPGVGKLWPDPRIACFDVKAKGGFHISKGLFTK